jgi:hypothetical protein
VDIQSADGNQFGFAKPEQSGIRHLPREQNARCGQPECFYQTSI